MSDYQNTTKLGEGGFCEVWRCTGRDSKDKFAKKVLKVGAVAGSLDRFKREVRILSSLDHPNVVRIVDKALETPPYFYIMPLYDHSLRCEIQSGGMDKDRIFGVFSAVLAGVEYAHLQGIIHRDLKPENILMNSDTDIAVSDFGLGRLIDADTTRQTTSGAIMGTILYMAPEQLQSLKLTDKRADIFSLGKILYELYTGPLTTAVQDTSLVPPGIGQIITRCTQTDPDKRFQSVAEIRDLWTSIHDQSLKSGEAAELKQLTTDIAAATTVDAAQLRRLLELLAKYASDLDLLHTTIIRIQAEVIVSLLALDASSTIKILSMFIDFLNSQLWGFEYTDKIGKWCKRLFNATPNLSVRALMIDCVLVTGVDHNRYYVLDILKTMLHRQLAPGEDYILKERLEKIPLATRRKAGEALDLSLVDDHIKKYFQ